MDFGTKTLVFFVTKTFISIRNFIKKMLGNSIFIFFYVFCVSLSIMLVLFRPRRRLSTYLPELPETGLDLAVTYKVPVIELTACTEQNYVL